MEIVNGLKYSKEHEWIKVEGTKAYVGITDYAQHSLGSIVFVELPEIGAIMNSEDVLGVVESVKAASDIFIPVSGTIIEINKELEATPEKMNEEPYKAWIAAVKMTDAVQLDQLMDAEEYGRFCKEAK
jgi:glycine cleavage system H protein